MEMLQNLLLKYKRKSDETATHTIIPDKNSKYNFLKFGKSLHVSNDEKIVFYDSLYDLIFNKKINFPITESFNKMIPLILDLDMKYEKAESMRYYTDDTIRGLCDIICEEIDKYYICKDEKAYECYITEKQKPNYKDERYDVKDGLHLIFPNIVGDTNIHKSFIGKLSDDVLCEKILEVFKSTSKNGKIPDNDVSDIIDTNVQRWFVYGCGKANQDPYLLTKIYDCRKFEFVENEISDKELIYKTSVVLDKDTNVEYKGGIDDIFKNTLTNSNSVSAFDMIDDENYNENVDYDPYLDDHNDDVEIMENVLMKAEIQNIEKIVMRCLSQERLEQYDLWIKLGMCLKNIGGDTLFDLWNKFSERGDKYDSIESCQKYWDGFKRDGLTIKTLHYWARNDNMDEYMKIREEHLEGKVDSCIFKGGQHDDVAEVVSGYFKDQFICADLKDGWFYFDGSKWIPCPKGYRLHRALSGQIKEIFYRRHQYYKREMDKLSEEGNEIGAKNFDGYQKAAYKIYDNLKNVTFAENIMKACKLKFYREKIMEQMDSNTKLFAFENCIFDLESNILREGRPDDLISITNKLTLPVTPNELPMSPEDLWERMKGRVGKYKDKKNGKWDYSKWDNGNTEYFDRVHRDISQFFREILPDNDIRKYCLRFIASRMCGDVLEQRFSIWTGSGGNGKSILIDIIRNVFGEYCVNLPVTLLTQKRKASNAACPEKARTRGTRICYMQEPDSGERINAGEMKELSGGDMIQARKLYSDVFEFKPQFEIVLMCNEKPTIEDKTNGAWRRVQVYPFVSRFVDDQNQINPNNNVYKRDKALPTKLEHWSIVFMGMLMREWVNMGGGVDEDSIPESIRMETENYKNQNDIVGQWISEDLDVCEDECIPFNEMWNAFENWFTENHSNGKVDKIVVKRRLIDWQKRSRFGFSDTMNGNERHPKFNLVPKPE